MRVVTPWLAVPVPRPVSGLELEVMSSCLVRQGREVEEGIVSLQANLHHSETRIKGMYKEVSLQQQGYCLHTRVSPKAPHVMMKLLPPIFLFHFAQRFRFFF